MENKAEEPNATYGQPLTFEKVSAMLQKTENIKPSNEEEFIFTGTDWRRRWFDDEITYKWERLVETLVSSPSV